MMNSTLLEVFIGLAFIYLLLSLVLTSWVELFSSFFKLRNNQLESALTEEILGSEDLVELFYKHPIICTFKARKKWWYSLLKFFGLKKLYNLSIKGRPTYLSSRTFAMVMLDLLKGGMDGIRKRYKPILEEKVATNKNGETENVFLIDGREFKQESIEKGLSGFTYFSEMIPDEKTREEYADNLCTLIKDGLQANQVDTLRSQFIPFARLVNKIDAKLTDTTGETERVLKRMAEWYDTQMERVTGVYKRKIQMIVVLFGLVFTIFLNADTIMMTRIFWNDSIIRNAVVDEATAMVKESERGNQVNEPAPAELNTAVDDSLICEGCLKQSVQAAADKIRKVRPFPIGWEGITDATHDRIRSMPSSLKEWIYKVIGLIITTLCISLGAPFWFDLLSKLVNIRNVGLKPKTASND